MFTSYQVEQKTFIEASCTYDLHTGENAFYNLYIWRILCLYFLGRVKKPVHTLVCMCSLYISREESNKQILFTRSKFFHL